MASLLLLAAFFLTYSQANQLVEYRIPLPVSVDNYKLAQLYRTIEESKANTGGGEGIEIVVNEPYEESKFPQYARKGQYTHKIYHLSSKVPAFIRLLAPKGSLEIHEKSWNSYPTERTELSNPEYMKDHFWVIIRTVCKPGVEEEHNIFNLGANELKQRVIDRIDIAADNYDDSKINGDPTKDPTVFKSVKTGRGPLDKYHWKEKKNLYPLMMCYKLVDIKFEWWGLQTKVEKPLVKTYRRLFSDFNRRLFTTIDEWYDLTLEEIRVLEAKAKDELDQMRNSGGVRGIIIK